MSWYPNDNNTIWKRFGYQLKIFFGTNRKSISYQFGVLGGSPDRRDELLNGGKRLMGGQKEEDKQ